MDDSARHHIGHRPPAKHVPTSGVPSWLKLLQDGFLVWVVLGAAWGWFMPGPAASGKIWIPEALAAVMLGMGLTLTHRDVLALRQGGRMLLLGVALQYVVMPLGAWGIATILGLPKLLALGVILVGACPGGTASNVVAYLARGDVALSVGMTTVSTLLSPLLTPLWIWLLASTWLTIDFLPLFWTVTKIVLLPVVTGVLVRRAWQPNPWFYEGVLPLVSMVIIAWIVGVIVGLNHGQSHVAGLVVLAVIVHNALGLMLGYWGGRLGKAPLRHCRTVSLEVGMQNSGLAVALAVAHFGPAAAVPGVIFSIWHNVTGPLLASIWRRAP
ncbi:MAG: bile acid:sodium symporter family protein [Nitrospira sp. SB0677_bin_15]|nr:bile acid:sodium symporter family protein [Nitrospira sp. SB0667_bin_9]MYD30270.1 bile acid:sodium symporter family protein [Nitrospira sp. SB0661_bin_20]MYG40177.1 bile acid:sodium symporter family protein [Nitrospira sp. SB0677_bin_15]MYJ22549.1 bile acid:sodium symporter family protein [Nitrospira sp. SB0673_bin_12]